MNVQDLINELEKLPKALRVVTPDWDVPPGADRPGKTAIRCVEVVPADAWYGHKETVVSLSLTSVVLPPTRSLLLSPCCRASECLPESVHRSLGY